MVHRVDGPIGVYRGFDDGTDARIAALNRCARRRDRPPVALQPREAPGARARAARSGRDPERRRSGDLPPARAPRAARRAEGAGWSPRAGRTTGARAPRRSRGSTATSTGTRYELTFVGRAPIAVRADPVGRAGRLRGRRRALSQPRRLHRREPGRSRARTRSSRRSPAGCRRRFSRAAATRSSSARAGCRFEDDEELPDVLDRLVEEIEVRRAAISIAVDLRGRRPLSRRVAPSVGSRLRWRTSCDAPGTSASFRVGRSARPRRGLARARRLLRVGRVDAGDLAREPGAEEPARPLDLPGDHGRDAAGRHRRDRAPVAAAARSSSRPSATCSARARSSRSTSSRCATTTRSTRGSRTSRGARPPIRTSSRRCASGWTGDAR